jgi:hypothetical protein
LRWQIQGLTQIIYETGQKQQLNDIGCASSYTNNHLVCDLHCNSSMFVVCFAMHIPRNVVYICIKRMREEILRSVFIWYLGESELPITRGAKFRSFHFFGLSSCTFEPNELSTRW